MSQTILVVDDELTVRESLAQRLLEEGFVVLTASDGPEALTRFRADKPDLVVLDLMLPGLPGIEAIAVQPEVIMMDEPASALDPTSTRRIEELMLDLRSSYTIVIVTHNMQQAARVSDRTAFFSAGPDAAGRLVEVGPTEHLFTSPGERLTEDYISGRFG